MADATLDHPEFPVRLPLQRRRVWRACECCRRKKIKCDGREPVCSQCTQTNSTCNWIQTKDRAALSRHYVQELEARLIQMEGLLTQVGSTPNDLAPASSTPSKATLPSATSTPTSRRRSGASSTTSSQSQPQADAPAYLVDPAVKQEPAEPDHFGQLAVDTNGHLRWIGGSSAMTLVDAFRNISRRSGHPTVSQPRSSRPEPKTIAHNLYFPPVLRFDVRALPGPEQAEFPPRDLADKLVAAYFTHFHHTLPVVDSTAFLSQYRRLMDERRISSTSETGFATVVFAVFACAARFVDDPRLISTGTEQAEGGMAAVYYERAMILYYIGHTATQLAHVQAFVLLSSFLASINSLPQSWLMCGQAVRIAQDLGLHRSPQHLLLTPIDKETRRKVWWCVYGLDRMLAVALGRPLGIDDADCDVELPLDIDDVSLPKYFAAQSTKQVTSSSSSPTQSAASAEGPVSLMKGFNALTCLFKIAGQVLRSVYALDKCKENLDKDKMAELQTSVDRLDRLLTEWCEKLPAPFKSNPQTQQQVSLGAILCSCYYTVTVTLHRNFIPTSVGSQQVPRSSSVAKAVTASRSCIFLAQSIKDVIPSSHWLAFFSQYLFSSAIIILLCIMHATDQNAVTTAMSEVDTAVECLGSLESSWPGAKRCREILKELAEMTLSRLQADGVVPAEGVHSLQSNNHVTDGNTIRSPGRHLGHIAPSPAAFSPSVSQSPAAFLGNGSRKRSIDEVSTPSSRPLRPTLGKPVASMHSPMYTPARLGSAKPSPATPFGYREALVIADDSATETSTSYGFSAESSVAPSPQYASWNTPRSTTGSLGGHGDHTMPLDLTSLGSVPSPLPSTNPFAISFGTPSTSNLGLNDSAYIPSFAYAGIGDPSDVAHMTIGSSNVASLGIGMTAPSPSQFDLSDLPYSGMDFLQSLGGSFQDSSTASGDHNEALWAQLGASPFKLAPELPIGTLES